MLGLAVSLGVPPPNHNVISGFSLSCAGMSPGAIIVPHLLLSHLSNAPPPALCWKLSFPLLIPLVFKLHT